MGRTGIVTAEKLSFSYTGDPVFTDVAFSLWPGDFAAVIGGNGTGKSTLLKLLLGELQPIAGSIELFGQDSVSFKNWPKIGYVPQAGFRPGVAFPATCAEVVRGGLFAQVGLFRFPNAAQRQRAQEALELVGMGDYAREQVSRLSGGQQQRVMLAQVLAGNPELLILDEPTTGVDSRTVDALYTLLCKLNKEHGLTILMVTHDIHSAARLASRVFCLEDGSLVELTPDELQNELKHRHVHPKPQKGGGDSYGNFSV